MIRIVNLKTNEITERPPNKEELDEIEKQKIILLEELPKQIKKQRKSAYQDEADPLFFKAQRGEIPLSEWLAKVEEIKQRYTVN
jgi:hypothetical protein